MPITRKKTTTYLDPDLLHSAKVLAARTGRHDYEILEDALRQYLGWATVADVWGRTSLDETAALALADAELHAMRVERHAARW